MNYGDGSLSASDVALLTNRNGDSGFGNEGSGWWIILFLIFAFMGWGRNGFGGNSGGNGGYETMPYGYNACCAPVTQQGMADAFNFNNLDNAIRGVQNGLCDGFYAMNTSILNLGQSLLQCCCDTKTGIMQNGYETRDAINTNANNINTSLCNGFNGVNQSINTLGYNLQDCCCQTQRAIDGVNYNMATQACDTRNTIQNATRDILESNNNNTRAILDFLTNDKISTLQAENQSLKFQASQTAQNAFISANQSAQTAELIRRLGADCPVNAVVVQPNTPVTFPTNCCGQFSGYNNSCGCNGCC